MSILRAILTAQYGANAFIVAHRDENTTFVNKQANFERWQPSHYLLDVVITLSKVNHTPIVTYFTNNLESGETYVNRLAKKCGLVCHILFIYQQNDQAFFRQIISKSNAD